MANVHDTKEKMIDELFSKKRSFSNIYNDSMDILKDTESELNRILAQNQKDIDEMTKKFNYSDEDLHKLKSEIEEDFNVKIDDVPETVVMGKASKEVFENIYNDLNETIIGEDEACKKLSTAFRRPYVVGSDPQKIRNSILLYGSNGTGRHLMVTTMGSLLKKYGLAVSSEVYTLDMSRYQSSSQEVLFLQDMYVALTGKNPIVLIENFAEASPIFNRMLNELVLEGTCVLSKRYTLKNNQLVEATSTLTSDVIDHLSGNNKVLVFVTESKPSDVMDVFGKSFIDKIADKVETQKLDEEAIKKTIDQLVDSLIERCEGQLEIKLVVDDSIKVFLDSIYEPNDGIDSLIPSVQKIYNEMVDIALENDLDTATISYDETIKASFGEKSVDLEVIDDAKAEREEIQKELDEVVGLDHVKNYLLSLENLLKINQVRKQKGLKTNEISKHMIFTGNPGTGKTTIARLVSRMMKACGILKQGQLVEVTRADLVGKYVGHTAPLTMSVIQSAIGGVLFIDEAYSLYRGKDDSFGLEAIDTLVKAMEDHRDDLIVILAGYTKEMKEFLEANSGLKSRFANIIEFEDYTGEELMLIAKSIAKGKDYVIADDALRPLQDYFTLIQAKNDPNSGNGRLARNLVEDAILNQSKRLLEHPDAQMNLLERVDFNLENI